MTSPTEQTFSHHPAIPPPLAIPLTVLPEHPCSYFPERPARSRAFRAKQLPPELYHGLMDAGFRRSGDIFYQPICSRCRDCQPIRVPVAGFVASKSQRRALKRSHDLHLSVAPPRASDESFELYLRYLSQWHGRAKEEDSREAFERFLYHSPVESLEFSYRDKVGKLLAVGICDVSHNALSSVYYYFDPAERSRSLGTFGAMVEIDYARKHAIPFYYLGYWIRDSETMRYKNRYMPNELLCSDGVWRAGAAEAGESYSR
jgi:arginine-tRNA-protein transferase